MSGGHLVEGGRAVDRFHRDFQERLEMVEVEYVSFASQLDNA